MKQTEKASVKTPEGFLELLKKCDPPALSEAVAPLTDAERKKLSKTAQEYCKAIRKEEREARRQSLFLTFPNKHGGMARLAVLAAAPKTANLFDMQLTDVGRNPDSFPIDLNQGSSSDFEAAAIRILLDRRPDWARAWMERQIEGTTQWNTRRSSLKWVSVKQLLDDGLCQRPTTEDFAEYMSNILRLVDLREHPDLIQDLWQQFQFDAGFFRSFGSLNWPTELTEQLQRFTGTEIAYVLAQHGLIERNRLLDEILQALWREFDNNSRGNLIKLHDKVDVTDEEFLARQSEYIRLLQNPVPATVAFAIKTLKAQRKLRRFQTIEVIDAIPVVFDIERKTQPKSALSLLKTLTGKDKKLIERGTNVAASALRHPEIDIQESALKLLEGWASVAVPTEALKEMRSQVSAVTRTRIDSLLGDEPDVAKETGVATATVDVDALEQRAGGIDPQIRNAWKLDESLAAFHSAQMFPVVSIDASPVNLDRLEPIEPVRDVLELVDTINAAMERISSPLEMERILDGISRFGKDHYPDDFSERVAAITGRFGEHDTYELSELGLASTGHALPALCRLVICWLQQGSTSGTAWLDRQLTPRNDPEMSVTLMLENRAHDLYQRLRKDLPAHPLLSLPTHQYGWIDPQVFVDRLKSNLQIDERPFRSDLRNALWRLAPVTEPTRQQVVEKAKELPDQLQRLLLYAIGEDVKPGKDDKPWAAEWLAAGRARTPHGDLPELEVVGIPDAAYGLRHGRVEVLVENSPTRESGYAVYEKLSNPMVKIEPPVTDRLKIEDFSPLIIARTMSARGRNMYLSFLPDWGENWLATLWPANPEPFIATGVTRVLRRLDNTSSNWDPVAGSLMPLLRPDRDWSRTAIYAIWLAAFSRDADARAVATDALIEGLLDGRAHPEPLAEVLVQLCRFDFLKFGRLADTLKEVFRVSNWSALVIGEVLNAILGSWEKLPRDAHHLLGVQLEALMQVDGGLTIEARQPLGGLKGSSKTAKLAKQLLALTGSSESAAWKAALAEGLDIRLRRAEANSRRNAIQTQ